MPITIRFESNGRICFLKGDRHHAAEQHDAQFAAKMPPSNKTYCTLRMR
jgi:hypothetical protein